MAEEKTYNKYDVTRAGDGMKKAIVRYLKDIARNTEYEAIDRKGLLHLAHNIQMIATMVENQRFLFTSGEHWYPDK